MIRSIAESFQRSHAIRSSPGIAWLCACMCKKFCVHSSLKWLVRWMWGWRGGDGCLYQLMIQLHHHHEGGEGNKSDDDHRKREREDADRRVRRACEHMHWYVLPFFADHHIRSTGSSFLFSCWSQLRIRTKTWLKFLFVQQRHRRSDVQCCLIPSPCLRYYNFFLLTQRFFNPTSCPFLSATPFRLNESA